jgi:hypothetical protein
MPLYVVGKPVVLIASSLKAGFNSSWDYVAILPSLKENYVNILSPW